MRRDILTLVAVMAAGACSLDWDRLDPREAAPGPGVTSGTTGASSSTGGGTGGSGGQGASGGGSATEWFDPGLSRRRPLTAAGVGEPLSDFPVLVVLDDSRIDYAAAAVDGEDLRFEAGGQLLAHDIDHWEPGGTSTVWVRLPSLTAGAILTMYYGGKATSAPMDPGETWSADYLGVWHLDGNGRDASGNGLDGTVHLATPVTGFVGRAYDFDLVALGRIDIPSTSASANAFVTGGTVSAIVQARTLGENGKGRILDRSGNTSFAGGWGFSVTNTNPEAFAFGHDYDMNFGYWLTPAGTVAFDTWQHVAATANVTDQTVTLYIDGEASALQIFQSGTVMPEIVESHETTIGSRQNSSNRAFDGIIDEVRLSGVVRSAAWMDAEAKAARDELLAYGDEETAPP